MIRRQATMIQRKADLHVKELQFERRQKLSDLATTLEEQQGARHRHERNGRSSQISKSVAGTLRRLPFDYRAKLAAASRDR